MYLYLTQRTEARFKVFSESNQTIFSTFEYDNVDFDVGGTYDSSTYEYTIENAGTYLWGSRRALQYEGRREVLSSKVPRLLGR